jgi:hypothetical protein
MKRGIVAAAIAMLAFACGGRDVAPYQAALDALPLPTNWHVAQTTPKSQGGVNGCVELTDSTCPSVTRYFLVDGRLPDILQQAKTAAAAGGFTNTDVSHPECDVISSGPPCSLVATNDQMVIAMGIYRPGDDVDQQGLAAQDRAIVRMIIRRN